MERKLRFAFYAFRNFSLIGYQPIDSLLPFSQAPTLSGNNCDPFVVLFLFEKHHGLTWELCAHENGSMFCSFVLSHSTYWFLFTCMHSYASGRNIYCHCRSLTKLLISNEFINIFMESYENCDWTSQIHHQNVATAYCVPIYLETA